MRGFLSSITRIGLSGLGSVLLVTSIMAIATIGLGMAGLYVFKYAQVTTEMRQFQCYVLGTQHPDCADYQKELDDLATERAALAKELAGLQRKIANLKKLEEAVDTITLFQTHKIGTSDYSLTVGNKYHAITNGDDGFDSYFCYIDLGSDDGVDRQLNIRHTSGDVDVDADTLRRAGLSTLALEYARAKCKPLMIGG